MRRECQHDGSGLPLEVVRLARAAADARLPFPTLSERACTRREPRHRLHKIAKRSRRNGPGTAKILNRPNRPFAAGVVQAIVLGGHCRSDGGKWLPNSETLPANVCSTKRYGFAAMVKNSSCQTDESKPGEQVE